MSRVLDNKFFFYFVFFLLNSTSVSDVNEHDFLA